MAFLKYNDVNLPILITILYLNFFFSNFYNNLLKLNKLWSYSYTKKKTIYNWQSFNYKIIINFFFLYLLTQKITIYSTHYLSINYKYIFVWLLLIIYINIKSKLFNNNYVEIFILISFFFFFNIISFIKNLLNTLFIMELYATIYYFFFLNVNIKKQINLINFKNLLLFYLWNSFITTFIYILGCFFIIQTCGSLDFQEINNFNNKLVYQINVIVISLGWKLGLPFFHFFKLEIYKYINKEVIILYSIMTLLSNILIFMILLNQNIIFYCLSNVNIFNLIIIFSVSISFYILKIKTFYHYIAFSNILTLSFFLVLYLI